MKALSISLYIVGWLVFVIGQAHNSIQSNSNGLTGGAGWKQWLKLQLTNLMTRAFFCAIFYGYLVQTVSSKLQAVGLSLEASTVAGFAGYASNALLYQIFGLLPWLRVEVPDLAPPANSEIVPVSNSAIAKGKS